MKNILTIHEGYRTKGQLAAFLKTSGYGIGKFGELKNFTICVCLSACIWKEGYFLEKISKLTNVGKRYFKEHLATDIKHWVYLS